MGDLKWFKKENAPEGSTVRCTDGCKVERESIDESIESHVMGFMAEKIRKTGKVMDVNL